MLTKEIIWSLKGCLIKSFTNPGLRNLVHLHVALPGLVGTLQKLVPITCTAGLSQYIIIPSSTTQKGQNCILSTLFKQSIKGCFLNRFPNILHMEAWQKTWPTSNSVIWNKRRCRAQPAWSYLLCHDPDWLSILPVGQDLLLCQQVLSPNCVCRSFIRSQQLAKTVAYFIKIYLSPMPTLSRFALKWWK